MKGFTKNLFYALMIVLFLTSLAGNALACPKPPTTETAVPTEEPIETEVPTEEPVATETEVPTVEPTTTSTPATEIPAPTTEVPNETPTITPTTSETPTSLSECQKDYNGSEEGCGEPARSRSEWLAWKASMCEFDCEDTRTETFIEDEVNFYFGNIEGCLLDGCQPFVDVVTTSDQPLLYYGESFENLVGVKYDLIDSKDDGTFTRYYFNPITYLNWGLTDQDGNPILGMEQNRNIMCSLYPQPWNFNSDGDLVVSEGMNSSTVAQWMVEIGIYSDYMTAYRYVGHHWVVGEIGFIIPMPK